MCFSAFFQSLAFLRTLAVACKEGIRTAGHGVYQIPREFKDEDKWFKYFTKKQAVVMILCGFTDYRIIMFTAGLGLLPAGVVLSCALTAAAAGCVMIILPLDGFFLMGGGLTISELLFRRLYRKRNHCLRTKNMEREEDEG